MREIKFRGKHKRLGVWVYGYYTHFGKLHLIHVDKTYITGTIEHGGAYEVEPETIGQFTGLYDVEGQEIYEGDIIKIIVVAKSLKWDFQRNFVVEWTVDGWYMEGDPLHVWILLHTLKVIGNVHDNPDLLEVAHD